MVILMDYFWTSEHEGCFCVQSLHIFSKGGVWEEKIINSTKFLDCNLPNILCFQHIHIITKLFIIHPYFLDFGFIIFPLYVYEREAW